MPENPPQNQQQKEPEAQPEPRKYDAAYLREHALAFLNESPHIVAGALAAAPGNRKNFSLDEAKKLVADYTKPKKG